MNVSGTSLSVAGLDPSNKFAVRVQKLAQDQQKQDGEAAVQLIESAGSPVGPNGEGSHINTVA